MDEERELGDEDEFVPRRRAWVRPVAWIAVAALVLGGAFSSALTLLAGGNRPDVPDAAQVSTVTEERGTGSARVILPEAPADATALRVTFTCLSAGSFAWGIEQYGNPMASCEAGETGLSAVTDFRLPEVPAVYVSADDGAQWSVSAVYVALPQTT